MDEEGFKKTCIREKEKKGSHPPAFLRYMDAKTGCRKVQIFE